MNRKKRQKDSPTRIRHLPEREDILNFLLECNKPRSLKHIADALGMKTSDERKALNRRLQAMQRDGQIIKNRREGYGLVNKMDLINGKVMGHADGYGFVLNEAGGEDLYLSPREMRKVLHGDRVLARIIGIDKRGRMEGAVVEVLQRANQQVVGRYYKKGNIGFVVPDNKRIHQDILIPAKAKATSGCYVVVDITQQPDQHTQPVGEIVEILGEHMQPGMATEIAIRNYELPNKWPKALSKAIEKLTEDVKANDKKNREDIRSLSLVTIDGEDARDFDDAVYCEPQGTGWRLLVAIADVSHYVHANSELDKEAENRGNSVYFPQRVIPMLPEILSNGLCSLKPGTDRLCMVCELHIDKQGKVKRYRFYEAVMHSSARLTYTEVAGMLIEKDEALCKKYKDLLPHLENLYSLYKIMHAHRASNAVIEFDSTESRFEFDKHGRIKSIHSYKRNDAHRLIEEFMLAANVAAAEYVLEFEIPALFRVHETPKEEKLKDLRAFLGELSLQLEGGEEPTAKHYAKLLRQIEDREDAHLIQTVLLRSMALAVYSADNIGHFGLDFPAYAHFTSPIRRYPDLLLHRAIRYLIKNNTSEGFSYSPAQMQALGDHCSMTERRADEATRDVVQWHKCEYMQEKVGEEFEGIISSVTSFGLFVELDDIYIEGLVHITALPIDYYHFDPIGHRLYGERTGRTYRLANRVKVKVTRVDLDDKKIDFELIE